MLEYYSRRLSSVEINNTFYRMPRAEMLEKWASQVPRDFSFVLKANRRITHMKRLKDADDPLDYQVRTAVGALGERLGPILFQLPPYLRKGVERLRDFLAILPDGLRAAFEFRHESWFVDEVYQALADRGAALVTADTGEGDAPVVETASFGYARLRRPGYDEEALREWAEALARPAWSDVFVFFKHEDEGAGPRMAAGFREVGRHETRLHPVREVGYKGGRDAVYGPPRRCWKVPPANTFYRLSDVNADRWLTDDWISLAEASRMAR